MEYFAHYRNIVEKIQQLAGNITALKQKEWEDLNRLNEERSRMNSIIVNEVEAKITKLEEAVAHLTDYAEKAKKAVAHTSGPDSTTEDILALEPVWLNFLSLLEVVSPKLNMTPSFAGTESPSRTADSDNEFAGEYLPDDLIPNPQTPQGDPPAGQSECIAALEEVAAAAIDPAPVKKDETPAHSEKKFSPEKNHQNKPAANKAVLSNKKKQKAKNAKAQKESVKNHALSVIPAKIIPYETGDILLDDIKRNVEAIKQGKR